MKLHIRPDGNDRFVAIESGIWNSQWRMQFPEIISAKEGTIMAWTSNYHPETVVVAGDLNMLQQSPVIELLTKVEAVLISDRATEHVEE